MRISQMIPNFQNTSKTTFLAAPENTRICKTLKVSEIPLKRPSLNKQIKFKKL